MTDKHTRQRSAVRMRLENAYPATGVAEERLPGVVNYLKGNATDWRVNIPTFQRVVYPSVYSGIDMVFYGNNSQLEYDLVIAPGADPSRIVISIAGSDNCKLDASGSLQIFTSAGVLNMHRPVAYQIVDGSRHTVPASYHLRGNRVTFRLAKYDRSRPLTIDPAISYSTLLGGNGATSASAIAVDSAGNAYIAGYTNATNFPATAGAFRTVSGGPADGFVTKLNSSGTIVFSTYIGGAADDYINGIATDSSGYVYATGYTFSGGFPKSVVHPGDSGSPATNIATVPDAFVLKMGPAGNNLVYSIQLRSVSSFLDGWDQGNGIAVDNSGRAYVTGQTTSSQLYTTAGVYQPTSVETAAGDILPHGDAFVVRLGPTGATEMATYVGGPDTDTGRAIAVDSTGSNIYVTGSSKSTNFPAPATGTNAGSTDAFVAKLSGNGTLTAFSFFGGLGDDDARAIAVSASNVYIAGQTSSTSLPSTSGKVQPAFGGGTSDGYLAQLNSSALVLAYSTYLGGSTTDAVNGITVDASGNIILAGNTDSNNFPIVSPLPSGRGGLMDAFVTKLNANATTYLYSTFLGGVSDDVAQAVATNGSDVFVAGHTFSANFPVTSASAVARPAAFITRIAGAQRFVPITPCRIVDTRNPAGPFGGPFLNAGQTRDFAVPNSGCGVPSTAQAYALNVTVVPHGRLGYLALWPAGQAKPLTSTLNSYDGRIKANAAIMGAGTNGAVSVYATDATDVILDINGYFVDASAPSALTFYPITPCRIADTRSLPAGPLAARERRTFPVLASACAGSIPATVNAYSLNFTVVPKGFLGFLTTWPTGVTQPLVSTLNAGTGAITANAAIIPAGTNGAVDVFASDPTDVVIDINGYFAPPASNGVSLYTMTPCRVLDTRNPSQGPQLNGARDLNVITSSCSPPADAKAYIFNATVVPSGSLGFLTLWPQAQPQPYVSTLNAADAAITSNMAIVPTSNGSISMFSAGTTDVILDISGYFAP